MAGKTDLLVASDDLSTRLAAGQVGLEPDSALPADFSMSEYFSHPIFLSVILPSKSHKIAYELLERLQACCS